MAEIIVSKGETNADAILNYDSMFVLKGGKAVRTTLNYGGSMYVSKGGTAGETAVSSGGRLYVSGGKATSANVFSSGYFVLEGGTINNLTLEKASGTVSSGGGTINDLKMSGGFISFSSGTINRANVDHGNIYVYSGGKINSATFNGGRLGVSSNCTANKITLESGASMDVSDSKSKASDITVKTGGSMYIGSGAVVSNIMFAGGDADPAKDKYSGRLAAHGGTIKGLTIGSGTSVGLFEGCSATKVSWTPGNGVVNIWGASVKFTSKYSGIYLGSNGAFVSNSKEIVSETLGENGSAYVAKGGLASDLEVASGGKLFVWNGGKAVQAQVGIGENYSYLEVSSGGMAENVTVFEHGTLDVYGGKADGVTICSGGSMYVSGGAASGIKIESGGSLGLYQCTATDIEWTPFNGELQIYGNAQFTLAGEAAGVYIGTNGECTEKAKEVEGRTVGQVEETGIKITAKEEMYVMSGGKAKNTAVGNNGSMHVFNGGTADDTAVYNGGTVYVYNGGSARGVEVNDGWLAVNGGTVEDVTLGDYGALSVGGSAVGVTVGSSAYGYVEEGGVLNGATLCGGVYMNAGGLYVSSGAVVTDLKLEYGATLYVAKGAKVTNVTSSYGSYIELEKGASVKKITAVAAESPDTDHDLYNGWTDKKKKIVNSHVTESKATVIDDSLLGESIQFDDGPMTVDSHDNYVGYTDEIDFKKVHLNAESTLKFNIYATDASKFTIWRLDAKKNKLVSLQSTALKFYQYDAVKSSSSSTYYYAGTKGIKLAEGDYYLSVESTNAAKGGNAYYNVYLDYDSEIHTSLEVKDSLDGPAALLDMPDSGAAFADAGLNLQDDSSFGKFTDALADASAFSGLDAGLNGKSAWLDLASLA